MDMRAESVKWRENHNCYMDRGECDMCYDVGHITPIYPSRNMKRAEGHKTQFVPVVTSLWRVARPLVQEVLKCFKKAI